MGATYTRQSSYTDGDTITAAHTNDEFNQLLAAFQASSGHTHDGTDNEGGPVTKLLGTSITIGNATSGTDITVTFDGESNDGVLKWMEDEDYFEFSDDILVASTEKLQFRDTAIYINSSTDGQLDLVADSEIQIAATTIDINGNVDISGTLTIGSAGISEAELEILDGANVTTDELNILDGSAKSTSSITVADDDAIFIIDGTTTKQIPASDLKTYVASGDITSVVAGVGLSGGATTGDATLTVDFSEFSDVTPVNGDKLATLDSDGATEQLTTIASLATLFAGTGLSASSSVMSIDAAQTGITSLLATDIKIGEDDQTKIDFETANEIHFYADNLSLISLTNANTGDAVLTVPTADKNFTVKGTDDSSAITALDIDMALAGKATFNGDVVVGGDLTVTGDDIVMGTNTSGNLLIADGTNFNSVAVGSLSEISTVANDDVFLAVDTSGGGLKKIARSAIVSGLATSGAISNVVEDTSPQLGGDLDTNSANILIDDAHFIGDENGNEQIIFQTTSSAVNQFDVTNAATGNPPKLSATGGDSNIDFDIEAKGTGHVTVRGNTNSGAIQFNCESNSHGQIVIAQPHSEGVTNTLTLPAGSSSTLVSLVSTDTLTNKTLTSPVINTGTFGTSILPVSADGTTLGSATKEFSDLFLADGGTIQFGNDQEITLTHVADDGLILKHVGTGDGKEPSFSFHAGDNDIAADDVLGSIFFKAPDEGAGTDAILVAAGIEAVSEGDFSASSNATKLSFLTGASETAAEKMSLSSAGLLTVSGRIITDDTTEATSTTDGSLQTDGGLSVAKDAVLGDDVKLLSDSAVLSFGADSDTTLTHTDGTGLTLNSTNKLTFGDAASFVQQSSDGVLRIDGEATIDLNASTAVTVSNDLKLDSDSSAIFFGADSEIELRHVADDGLIIKHIGTGDGKEPSLTFQAGDNDIAANDVLGSIFFQAPDEGAGTDAILVAAGIEAVSEGDFSSSNNATKLSFKTGASETATEKVSISSGGNLTVSGRIITDDATDASSTTDGSLQTDGGLSVAKDAVLGNDVKLLSDSAVLNFGADSDVSLTHVADTALLLNSSRQLQFGDSGTYIHQSADGVLDLVSDTEIEINATTIDVNGAIDLSGDIDVGGNIELGHASDTTISRSASGTVQIEGNTIITTANADTPSTVSSASEVDHVLVNDGGVLKKSTVGNLGAATTGKAIAMAIVFGG